MSSSESSGVTAVRRSWRRRWLIWGVILLAILGLPGLYVLFLLWDGERPADADLLKPLPSVGPERNGAARLEEPEASVDWGEVESWRRNMAFTVHWDPKLANELIAKNAPAIGKLEEALNAPEFRLREVATTPSEWFQIAYLVRIRAHQRLESGRLIQALEDALLLVRFGRTIQSGGGVLMVFVTGRAFEALGFNTFQELIARCRPSRDESDWLNRELAVPFRWRDYLAATLRAEYGFMSRVFDEADPGDLIFDLSGSVGEEPAVASFLGPFLRTRFFFNRELTRRLFAESFRGAIAQVLAGADSLSLDPPVLWLGPIPAKNYRGKRSCRVLIELIGSVLDSAHDNDFQLAAARSFLALRRHQIEKGSLPASLEDLVPAYLPEVPREASRLLVGYDREGNRLFDPRKPGAGPDHTVAIEFDPPLRPSEAQK